MIIPAGYVVGIQVRNFDDEKSYDVSMLGKVAGKIIPTSFRVNGSAGSGNAMLVASPVYYEEIYGISVFPTSTDDIDFNNTVGIYLMRDGARTAEFLLVLAFGKCSSNNPVKWPADTQNNSYPAFTTHRTAPLVPANPNSTGFVIPNNYWAKLNYMATTFEADANVADRYISVQVFDGAQIIFDSPIDMPIQANQSGLIYAHDGNGPSAVTAIRIASIGFGSKPIPPTWSYRFYAHNAQVGDTFSGGLINYGFRFV